MELEAIKTLVAEARQHLNAYNKVANQLGEAGVIIEVDTISQPHGVVGVGRVDSYAIAATFSIEL